MPKNTNFLLILLAALFIGTALSSCKEDTPELDIPSSYSFSPMNYSGQVDRINMLAELSSYMKTGNEGAVLDASAMRNMFSNTNAPFSDSDLNSSTKQLESKTFSLDTEYFKDWFDVAAAASATGMPASNGQAGVLTNGSKSYLVDENGMEPTQLVEKGLMGACFYYQITSVYLGAERQSADNITSDPTNGTDLEHHWDEAFGYTSFPQDYAGSYPSDGLLFWAKYANGRDALLGCNDILMDAFKTGRAAISTNDLDTRDAQIPVILEQLELVCGGTAIHYLNGALDNFADDAIRNHELSEAIAFVKSLTYNPERSFSLSEIEEIITLIGENLYEVSTSDLTSARSQLAAILGLETIETQL